MDGPFADLQRSLSTSAAEARGLVALTLAPDGTILSASDLALRLLRLEARESIGCSIFSFLKSVDEEDRLGGAMLSAVKTGKPAPLRIELMVTATDWRQARATLEAACDATGCVGNFHLRVEPSESNASTGLHSASGWAAARLPMTLRTAASRPASPPARVGLVLVDAAGRIAQINDAAADLLGPATARDLVGRDAAALPGAEAVDLVHRLAGDYGRVSAATATVDLASRPGTSVRIEYFVLAEACAGRKVAAGLGVRGQGSGNREAAAETRPPTLDPPRGPATILVREVQAMPCPAPDARTAESLAAQAVAESSDAIIGLNADEVITVWNRAAQRILGYAPEEALGLDARLLLPPGPEFAEEACRIAAELARGETVRRIETRRTSKSGKPCEVILTQAPVHDAAGTMRGSVLILTDITKERNLEEALRRSDRLSHAGEMASMLAHEVRNPLSSAILNIEMLRDEFQEGRSGQDVDPEEVAMLLKRTHAELQELREAADAYLSLARMPAGSSREVCVNAMLEELTAFLAHELKEAGVRVEMHLDRNVPLMPLDPIRIKRSLMNLVRNAMEAMAHGGTLRLSTATDGRLVNVTIADAGIGMTESQVRRIFEPFFTTKPHGTGLGLSYAQTTVREHGGEIRCQSKPGDGTQFTVTLPIP